MLRRRLAGVASLLILTSCGTPSVSAVHSPAGSSPAATIAARPRPSPTRPAARAAAGIRASAPLWPALRQPVAVNSDQGRNLSLRPLAVVFACCACVVGCDLTPNVLFVSDGSPVRLLQLTDAQDECRAPRRVCFLATWDGQTVRGCWMLEQANVLVTLPGEERTVPVGSFRPTAYAEYRRASLD